MWLAFKRPALPAMQGITLYTSRDGSKSFVQACLPVAIKVCYTLPFDEARMQQAYMLMALDYYRTCERFSQVKAHTYCHR